jgi:phage terminase large subunit-like protein
MTNDMREVARLAAQHLRLFGEQAGRWAPLPHQIPPPTGTFYGWLLLAGRGAGKALSLDTPLPTPTGWTTMSDVQPGDLLMDESGLPVRVTHTSPVMVDHPCFRVGFSDGSEIIADADHRWAVQTHAYRKALRRRTGGGESRGSQCQPRITASVMTTTELRDNLRYGRRGDLNLSVPLSRPFTLPDEELPVDPYVLGAWLGDGCTHRAAITTMDPQVVSAFESAGYRLSPDKHQNSGKALTYAVGSADGLRIHSLHRALRLLGVLGSRHIPARYLRSSPSQRLALLQGLMDTDGHIDHKGCAEFSVTSLALADGVEELVLTLGWKTTRSEKTTASGSTAYRVRFNPDSPVVTLPRKLSRITPRGSQGNRHDSRMIVSVEPVKSVPVKCVAVDSESHLYLAGRTMIPTHNTDTCAKYMVDHVKGPPCLKGSTPHWMGIIAPTLGDAATSCFSGPSGISAHDPSAKMVNTIGGTIIRWPNGSEAKLFGAHSSEDTERLRSGGNRCISEHTLIKTDKGDVPIEDVRVGDRVWTRNGLRRVLKIWDNGIKEVRRYDHAAGSTWMTPDHEVWTDRGWREAAMVEPSDTVYTWESMESRSSTRTSRGTGTLSGTTATAPTGYCTDGSTGTITGRFQTAGRSTTKITTSRTTTHRIWKHDQRQALAITRLSILNLGIGTARVAGRRGIERSSGTSSAVGAVTSSNRGQPPERGTALQSAGMLLLRHEHGSNGCAACAAAPLSARPVMQSVPVRAGVLRSSHTSRVERVYDLTVEHDHEFFANGLLSSNCLQWLEELAAWRFLDATWAQMRFGLRSGPHPHWIGSTTPKPRQLIKRMDRGDVDRVVVSRASMYDNPHLPQEIRDALEDEYGGTQIGRQELLGQLIDEDENALWKHRTIDAARILQTDLPDLGRISVGVDPSGGAGEQGIVVAARSKLVLPPFNMPPEEGVVIPGTPRSQKHGYILADRTVHKSPDGWGKAAIKAAIDFEADEIFVETNYGGAMCVSVLRSAAESAGINIPIRIVTATRGKAVRAEPISALTSQGRWHHAGTFEALEDQMSTWHPDLKWSPDRLDAAVWNGWGLRLAHLMSSGTGSMGGGSMSQQITGGHRSVPTG